MFIFIKTLYIVDQRVRYEMREMAFDPIGNYTQASITLGLELFQSLEGRRTWILGKPWDGQADMTSFTRDGCLTDGHARPPVIWLVCISTRVLRLTV